MNGDDLAWLDAISQAELVAKGELTPSELVDAAIARIDRLNPQLNCVIFPRYEQAAPRRASGAAALADRSAAFLF